jgi:hypothetical protein
VSDDNADLFNDWQPIDTAPHDCGYVLLYATLGMEIEPRMGIYVGMPALFGRAAVIRGWWSVEGAWLSHVTHWRKLPSPPQT